MDHRLICGPIMLSAAFVLSTSTIQAATPLFRQSSVQSADGSTRNVIELGDAVALSGRVTPEAADTSGEKLTILESLKRTRVHFRFKLGVSQQPGKLLALKTSVDVQSPQLFDVKNEATIQTLGREANSVRIESDVRWHSETSRDLPSLLLEEPDYIVCGADRPGPAVWFVNGILTNRKQATSIGEQISSRLNRKVHVLHNKTVIESPYETGFEAKVLKDDLSEAAYDRIWPATISGRLVTESLARDSVDLGDRLQRNPVTRQLAWVLYHADEPVSLITHSQGCLIARNALFTLSLLGREEKARANVAWVAAGIPLHDCEICQCPKRMTVLDCHADPVPKFIGLRGGGPDWNPQDHDFVCNYLDQLTSDQVFPATVSQK